MSCVAGGLFQCCLKRTCNRVAVDVQRQLVPSGMHPVSDPTSTHSVTCAPGLFWQSIDVHLDLTHNVMNLDALQGSSRAQGTPGVVHTDMLIQADDRALPGPVHARRRGHVADERRIAGHHDRGARGTQRLVGGHNGRNDKGTYIY